LAERLPSVFVRAGGGCSSVAPPAALVTTALMGWLRRLEVLTLAVAVAERFARR
jgi:hypothetical protein